MYSICETHGQEMCKDIPKLDELAGTLKTEIEKEMGV